jgi:hypothetical protein
VLYREILEEQSLHIVKKAHLWKAILLGVSIKFLGPVGPKVDSSAVRSFHSLS